MAQSVSTSLMPQHTTQSPLTKYTPKSIIWVSSSLSFTSATIISRVPLNTMFVLLSKQNKFPTKNRPSVVITLTLLSLNEERNDIGHVIWESDGFSNPLSQCGSVSLVLRVDCNPGDSTNNLNTGVIVTLATKMSLPDYYYNDDRDSFAFDTCRVRWPKIIKDCIDDVKSTDGTEAIISGLNQLLSELSNNKQLTKFSPESVKLIAGLDSYNETFDQLFSTDRYANGMAWKTAPWLFTECYLYRRIDTLVKLSPSFATYDIFNKLKQNTFKSSAVAVYDLASRYYTLYQETISKGALSESSTKELFKEFVDVCLWGNKIDLSLLANRSLEDVASGQTAEARKEAEKNIILNDTDAVWSYFSGLKAKRRVDFVLDNSGFETYTDLVFSLFLLDSSIADTIVIHCKTRPWMVSDTLIKDVHLLIDDLVDPHFFSEKPQELKFIHEKLQAYLANGKISLQAAEFWTIDLDYWHITPEDKFGKEVYHELAKSDLVFIKGDLNYRKITGDRKWDKTTPFVEAIGPLADGGLKIVSLRTCKADVCVGLPKGKNEELIKYWHETTGEFGEMWASSGNWAVISFSK